MQNNKFLITLAAATFFFSSVCVNATPLVIPLQLGYEDPSVLQNPDTSLMLPSSLKVLSFRTKKFARIWTLLLTTQQ